jgi:excisionase family DNA binding protein
VSTLFPDDSTNRDRERAIRNMRERKHARSRSLRRKERRAAAVQAETALYVSIAEFAELTGVHPATVRRRIADGTLKHTRLVGNNNKYGRVLIRRDQLGGQLGQRPVTGKRK